MTKNIDSYPLAKIQSTVISKDKSSALLDRSIKIFYRKKNLTVDSIDVSIFDIFTRSQRDLSLNYSLQKFSIRGSSVAHIFSSEPYADIDIHGFIDLTSHSPGEIIRKGHGIKWKILDVIGRIINEKGALSGNLEPVIESSEQIIFEDQFVPLGTKQVLPFNIHTLRLGTIPIEFTFFAIVSSDYANQRFFDFNCGALELQIADDDETVMLHSSMPDMATVLEEITRRELRCESPSQLFRKSICRYLSKVSISGYYDKDPNLLASFLANFKERKGGFLDDQSLIQEVMSEIEVYFRDKNLNMIIPLLNLYFFHTETDLLGCLKQTAHENLITCLSKSKHPQHKKLAELISLNKFVETAWYLICLAKEIHYVSHRGKECFQIEIPLAKFFDKSEGDSSTFFLTLPLIDLWNFKNVDHPEIFLELLDEDVYFERYSEKVLVSLKVMLSNLFMKNGLAAPFLAILKRLKIGINQPSAHFLIHNLPSLNACAKNDIPLTLLYQILEQSELQALVTPSMALALIRQIYPKVLASKLFHFESTLNYPFLMHAAVMLLKAEKMEAFDDREKDIIFKYFAEFIEGVVFDSDEFKSFDPQRIKKAIQLSFLLYSKGFLTQKKALETADLCFKESFLQQGSFYLKTVLIKEPILMHEQCDEILHKLLHTSLESFFNFFLENKEILKQKKEDFSKIFEVLLARLSASKEGDKYLLRFIECYNYFIPKHEGYSLKLQIFQKAVLGQFLYLNLFDEFTKQHTIELRDFKSEKMATKEELIFLCNYRDFKTEVIADSDFALSFIYQALDAGLDLEVMHLIDSLIDSTSSLKPELLKVIGILSRKEQNFIHCLKQFNDLSLDLPVEACKPEVLYPLLDSLDVFLLNDTHASKCLADENIVPFIAQLHKKYVLQTIDRAVWPKLWHLLSELPEKYAFVEWISLSDMDVLIADHDPNTLLKGVSLAFCMDHSFMCYLLNKIKLFKESKQESYYNLIYTLVSEKSYQIFSDYELNKPADYEAAFFTFNIALKFVRRFIDPSITIEEVRNFLSLLIFSAAFGSPGLRENLLDLLGTLLAFNKTPFVIFVGSTGMVEEVISTMLDKALKEQNFLEINKIDDFISTMFVDEHADGRSFLKLKFMHVFRLPQLLQNKCDGWQKSIKEIFSKKASIEALEIDPAPLYALEYYCRYLSQVIISVGHIFKSEALPKATDEYKQLKEIKKMHLSALYKLLDFMSSKNFIKSASSTTHFLSLMGYLDKEEMTEFVAKYFTYSINQIKNLSISQRGREEQKLGQGVLRHSTVYMAYLYFNLKGTKDLKLITELLEVARSRMCCFTNEDHLIDSEFFNTFSYLEGFLSYRDSMEYHENWLKSIASRSSSVTYDEITLFTIFTYRCDSKFSKSVSSESNSRIFEDKLFINQSYFNSSSVLKGFVSLFDIAFSRFIMNLKENCDNPRAMNLDVFSLLGVYNKLIYRGTEELRNRAETTKIQLQFLDVLSKALSKEKKLMTLHLLQSIWIYLIVSHEPGVFGFKHKARDQMSKNISIFCLLVERLKELPDTFHKDHDVPFEQLLITYDFHKQFFLKELSKSQNEEILEFLTTKVTEGFIRTSATSSRSGAITENLGIFGEEFYLQLEQDLVESMADSSIPLAFSGK